MLNRTQSAPGSGKVDEVDGPAFRNAIGHFATGVTIITTAADGRSFGTTASAVSSLSVEPPMLLVCLNHTSTTGQAIARSGRFAVNVLAHDQGDLATHFSSKAPDKFAGLPVETGSVGQPLLPGALARMECIVTETTTGGTHTVFLAEVRTATVGSGSPLTYYRGRFGRFLEFRDVAAYDQLRSMVLDRTLALGVRLEVDALAERFGIERSSVVHALTRLTEEELTVRCGPFSYEVRAVDEPLMVQALEARCAVTVGMIRTCRGRFPGDRLEALRRAALAATPGPPSDDDAAHLKGYGRAVRDFHEAVVGLAGNDLLTATHRRLSVAQILAQAVGGVNWSEHHRLLAEGRTRLVAALERGDADAAIEATIDYTEASLTACRQAVRAAGGRI